MKRGDWIVAAAIGALLLAGSLLIFSAKRADMVVICVDTSEVYRTHLDTDATVQAGEGNVVRIEGGEAFMLEASCSDQICVHSARISRAGQSIICLPNRVTVQLELQGTAPDAVSY